MTVYSETLLYQVESALPDKWRDRVYKARSSITGDNAWHQDNKGFAICSLPAADQQPWLVTSLLGRDISFTPQTEPLDPVEHYRPRQRSLCTGQTVPIPVEAEEIYRFIGSVFSTSKNMNNFSPRTYPSAGGLYPVQVVVAHRNTSDLEEWESLHYISSTNSIESLSKFTSAEMLCYIGHTDTFDPRSADFIVAYLVLPCLSIAKYEPRGYKFSLLEVGTMQESARQAGELSGWQSRAYGYYDELGIAALFGLNPDRAWIEGLQFFGRGEVHE